MTEKLVFLFFVMAVDVSLSACLCFVQRDAHTILGSILTFFHLILILWFFFLIWKTTPFKEGFLRRLCCKDFGILAVVPLYIIFLVIDFFVFKMVSAPILLIAVNVCAVICDEKWQNRTGQDLPGLEVADLFLDPPAPHAARLLLRH